MPHWNSPPIITFLTGVHSRFVDAYWPMWNASAACASLLSMLTSD